MNSILHVPLYSNALYLILANGTSAIFGFVFWIIAARLYTTEAVGIASAIISIAALLEMLSGHALGYGLMRFLNSSNNPTKLVNSSFTMASMLSLAVAGIFLIGLGIWAPGLSIIRANPFYMIIFLLYVPILVLDDLTDYVMLARQQARFVFIHSLIFNIFRLALPVLLAIIFQSFGIFSSWGAATCIALLVSLFLLVPRVQPGYHLAFTLDKKVISEMLHFSFLNYLSDILWNIPSQILPIIVINLLGAKNNAYFYIAWAMSGILALIPTAVAFSLLAEGSRDETQLKNNAGRSFKIMAILLIPGMVLAWFLTNKFLSLFGSLYAKNAAHLLHWLIIAAFPLSINLAYFSIKRVQKKIKPIILLSAIMAVIVVFTSYLLSPRLGINGVGIAWLIGQSIIALIAMAWDIKRWLRV